MIRKSTKQSRGINAAEYKYQQWAKLQACMVCGSDSGSIMDHWQGSAKKLYADHCRLVRVHVGHELQAPLCFGCDSIKTSGSLRLFNDTFGNWLDHWVEFRIGCPHQPPQEVYDAIQIEIDKHG